MSTYLCSNNNVSSLAAEIIKNVKRPVFVCIGSAHSVGDSFGPMVGSLLTTKYNIDTYVYGNLQSSVNAKNISSYISLIKAKHPNCQIVVIDSKLGNFDEIGTVNFCKGSIMAAVLNMPIFVGDYSICAATITPNLPAINTIKNIALNKVYEIADFVAKSIAKAIKTISALNRLSNFDKNAAVYDYI